MAVSGSPGPALLALQTRGAQPREHVACKSRKRQGESLRGERTCSHLDSVRSMLDFLLLDFNVGNLSYFKPLRL